jgi:hypothetical protein
MGETSDPIELAERVASIARGLGIETALIGAYALAVHRYVRGSSDIDLASDVQLDDLRRLRDVVNSQGLHSELRSPDAHDDLGGVLVIWTQVDEDGDPLEPLDVVNFRNPYRPRSTPATTAIRDAVAIPDHPSLRCPQLADLIALKLDAGARHDLADVVQLLVHNPDADLAAIRETCARYGFTQIEELIAEAAELRQRSR